jgi:rhamnosyltransferase subunit B
VRLGGILAELGRRGHEAIVAAQQIGAVPEGVEVWQAPLWPRQITALARRAEVTPATMGDILAVLGLGEPGVATGMIGAWDRILAAVRPDAVIAEFAPGLSLACFGRVPLLSVGTGFALPPADLDIFPSLTGQPTVHDEGQLLDTVNAALATHGRSPRSSLPGIFQVDRELAAVFTELDPYRPWRKSALGFPSTFMSKEIASGEGDELFVYMNGRETRPNALWQGLAKSGLKVRIFDPMLSPSDRAILARAGLIVEPRPVPFDLIAARSRLVVSHGGLGFVSAALMAGLPQIILPFDIEKHMIAASIEELGLGRRVEYGTIEAESFAGLLQSAFGDTALTGRSRAAAPGFGGRFRRTADEEAADAIEQLLG